MNSIKQKLFNSIWKTLVWIDYVIWKKKLPKSIELTHRKDLVKIDGKLLGFYSKSFPRGLVIFPAQNCKGSNFID
ncbi:hypothetical protein [Chryseobacterium mucoviscidosis]|uniref:hypothetical protein n=1 Tax=Chryseobacterium mucoviscidosis TaxID=1945581 RepID=UPI0031E36EFD